MTSEQLSVATVDGAITFARQTWRKDGAEGETVHLLCDAIEQMRALAHCSWCGERTANDPRVMAEHIGTCEKRKLAEENEIRCLRVALENALHDLSRAPCRWPEGVPHECSEGDPCLTHQILGWALQGDRTAEPDVPHQGGEKS